MATDQTAAVPPSRGRTIFAKNGCTENKRKADRKIVNAVTGSIADEGLKMPFPATVLEGNDTFVPNLKCGCKVSMKSQDSVAKTAS